MGRHLARRNSVFGKLGSWPIELVVERSLASSTMPLSPSNALLRVFEAISSGLLQEDGPGIKDPCEREQEDVLGFLTTQEREDITRFAMEAVRKIHYGKIHEILDMKKLSEEELKKKASQVPEDEYFEEEQNQSESFWLFGVPSVNVSPPCIEREINVSSRENILCESC